MQKPWVPAGVLWKPPKRRLWRMKRGGFEEVSRFSRHNVAGNRLTRRCRLSFAIERKSPAGGKRRKSTGKICRRRHVSYANVLLAESHPPEAIEEKTTGKICRRRQKEKRLRGKGTTGERSTKFRKKGLTFLSYLL